MSDHPRGAAALYDLAVCSVVAGCPARGKEDEWTN